MKSTLKPEEWLNKWKCNGVSLQVKELLYYRSRPFTPPFRGKQGSHTQQGSKLSKQRGRGMEFDEVRHYQPGDDIRAIDWRVTARTGDTYTKLFREEKERPVFVCVDLSHSMRFGSQLLFKSVCAAHIAAAIGWAVAKRGDRIGGLVFTDSIAHEMKPQGREKGVLRWLKMMIRTEQESASEAPAQQTLYKQLQRLQTLVTPGSDVILISDFSQLDQASLTLIRGLRRHNRVLAINVYDPLEISLPEFKGEALRATDGDYEVDFDFSSPQFKQAYEENSLQLQEQQLEYFKSAGVPILNFSAGSPPEEQWQESKRQYA
ncbi:MULTISPECIES: DUF58 domain-containing protein [Gammaproteobacteria]|uniref:DUF58 domain-containing protein n=1 Tax=Gammaproteobacteria TaxID=1236 RepID=UPI000DD05EC9|nr:MULTISPECIES: DUF58 domain-containing protein [Gammaproteobacteria]RTE86897.1 DUF58 domain-containing protein [Aliidiomarina sp. B3213]TCZ93313.1 DUF58 domain-containing protein [Lysobacter sp. N42]